MRSREEHQDRFSFSSEEEESSLVNSRKKKQGRPVTTGEGVEIRARKAARKELQNLEKEKQDIEKILKGGYDPSEFKGERKSKRMEDLEEEMQNLPSKDIGAQMTKAAKQVELIAAKSNNLKGGFVKILKEAVLKISVGTDALICRSLPKENESAREMERLREEIRTLKEEMVKLRVQRDQELMPPPPSQQVIEREQPTTNKMEIEDNEGERNVIDAGDWSTPRRSVRPYLNPICVDQGRKADHTLGSQQCTTQKRRGKVGETGQQRIALPLPVEGAQTRTMRDNEKEEQPKPQRLPRNRIGRNQDAPSTSAPREEEEMETEPLEEGREERE